MSTGMKEPSTACVFTGGTLHGHRQGRLMRGYIPAVILEPIYATVGKDDDCHYKNITHRQVYVRDAQLDVVGAIAYRLDQILQSTKSAA